MSRLPEPADETTSKKMRAVRQSGTSPEIAARRALESLGVEFEVNVEGKPGRPDIWITPDEVPVFVHGCFWHRHEGCKKATMPKKNREFWAAKFQRNLERDGRKMLELKNLGYSPVVIWQCETENESSLEALLMEKIGNVESRASAPR